MILLPGQLFWIKEDLSIIIRWTTEISSSGMMHDRPIDIKSGINHNPNH